jgi:hypothetical protein
MTAFTVECRIGTLSATVEAESSDDAIAAAITQWDSEAVDIFAAGTFDVSLADA